MNTRISQMLVCDYNRVAALTTNGKVHLHVAYSDETAKYRAIEDRANAQLTTRVIFGSDTTVLMDADGNLSAFGNNEYGQVNPIANWKGPFADVVCAFRHSVGLRKDGTVVACGWKDFNQCDVSGWKDITAIAAGLFHTLGLRKDGTVVGCGNNGDHQLDINGWTDIVAITCSDNHSVGLKRDGTVVACGNPEYGAYNVSDWQDITKVICGDYHTVGLKSDGTVVACGANDIHTQNVGGRCDVDTWTDVKDIACSDYFTLGLKNDGTVLFCGHNNDDVADARNWTDIVHIACNERAVFGLKKDGTVVTCGTGEFFSYEPITKWKLFSSYETVDEDYQENLNKRTVAAAIPKVSASTSSSVSSPSVSPSSTSPSTPTYSSSTYSSGGSNWFAWTLLVIAILAGIYFFLIQPQIGTGSGFLSGQSSTQATEPDYPVAYVEISDTLNLRTAPGQSYDIITTMPNGAKVYVQTTHKDWAYVIYENHKGWCSADYLNYAE